MTWPGIAGAEMDPAYPYTGHFNLLNKFKKQHPAVKTLISVGGWAETGGYFDDNGDRIDSGGFYRMTTNADNSVNVAGINTFADSVVTFLRTYGFDGVDIDYEYPTSNAKAGNPLDFAQADAQAGRPQRVLPPADEDAAGEARRRRGGRRQVLPADRGRARLRLAAARHGDLPGHAVPRLRQHHVLRPARRLEQVRRPERGAVRRRQRRRAGHRRRLRRVRRTSAT